MPLIHRHLAITLAGIVVGAFAMVSPPAALARTGSGPAGFETPGQPPTTADASAAGPGTTTAPVDGGGAPHRGPPRLTVVSAATANGYRLQVTASGGRPQDVQVTPNGQGLNLSLSIRADIGTSGVTPDGLGDQHVSSGSAGSVKRWLPLPADADLGRLTREVQGDTLLLRIPRAPGHRDGGAADPKRGVKPNQDSGQGAH